MTDVEETKRSLASVGNIDNSAKQSWQKLIDSKGPDGSYRSLLSARDQFDYGCYLHAILHRVLSAAHWDLLVGKFSTSTGNRVGAIGRTIPRISSPAPALFIYEATSVWFIRKMKGVQCKRSTDVAILPAEFYDMNTWDTDVRPDSSRGCWRLGIHKCLEAMQERQLSM